MKVSSAVAVAIVLTAGLRLPLAGADDPKKPATLGEKVVAFCAENKGKQVGGGQCADLATAALKAAGINTKQVGYTQGQSDLTAPLTAVGATTADFIAPYGSAADCANQAKSLQQLGITDSRKIMTAPLCLNSTVIDALGDWSKWTYAIASSLYGDPTDKGMPAYEAVIKRYKAQKNAPDPWHIVAFSQLLTTVRFLNEVVERADLPAWQAADIGASARLQDGRLVWLFGDTLRETDQFSPPMVGNSMLVTSGDCVAQLMAPGDGPVIPDVRPGIVLWPMSVVVLDPDEVHDDRFDDLGAYDEVIVVLCSRIQRGSDGNFDFRFLGTSGAVFGVEDVGHRATLSASVGAASRQRTGRAMRTALGLMSQS